MNFIGFMWSEEWFNIQLINAEVQKFPDAIRRDIFRHVE